MVIIVGPLLLILGERRRLGLRGMTIMVGKLLHTTSMARKIGLPTMMQVIGRLLRVNLAIKVGTHFMKTMAGTHFVTTMAGDLLLIINIAMRLGLQMMRMMRPTRAPGSHRTIMSHVDLPPILRTSKTTGVQHKSMTVGDLLPNLSPKRTLGMLPTPVLEPSTIMGCPKTRGNRLEQLKRHGPNQQRGRPS